MLMLQDPTKGQEVFYLSYPAAEQCASLLAQKQHLIFLALKASCQTDAPAMRSRRAAFLIGQTGSRNTEPHSAQVEWASHGRGQAAWKEDKLEDVACKKGSVF